MAFDPSDFYICLTGLPKRVSTGRYHQSANDNMVYYIQLERILQKRFEELNGSGEVILHLYGDKQIVVLFSVWEGTIQERNERAQQIAQTACEELERMYEQTYLKDGAYANVTLLSERLCSWSQIGEQMRRMTERWNRCFFSDESEGLAASDLGCGYAASEQRFSFGGKTPAAAGCCKWGQ